MVARTCDRFARHTAHFGLARLFPITVDAVVTFGGRVEHAALRRRITALNAVAGIAIVGATYAAAGL
jgi:hypothetical protein